MESSKGGQSKENQGNSGNKSSKKEQNKDSSGQIRMEIPPKEEQKQRTSDSGKS